MESRRHLARHLAQALPDVLAVFPGFENEEVYYAGRRRRVDTQVEKEIIQMMERAGLPEVQDDAGDLHGLSQATVSRICIRVAMALAKHAATVIKMPESLIEEVANMKSFKRIKIFPNVIAAIDCTHIKIKKVVCDANLKICNVVARWRGSTHDCRIFDESILKEQLEAGKFKGRLVGDSGYKLQPYLFTPILKPQNAKEERYNAAH
ncbi:putative nuclease HARBI1 [Teleopsis dalmanni]|uniref:putative nuclease HARBI1 n=1 Tax=Teleopsis dalmanni TaxID=139649 RepID=UPI0018CF427C|nr:putative nuclease HARBI1 [Teleopsis dalmanni]